MYKIPRIATFALALSTTLLFACADTDDDVDAAGDAAEDAAMPAPAPAPTAPSATMTAQLEAKDNSGITGDATATHNANDVTVLLNANGLKPGSYPAHIHTGTCASGGPVAVELTPITSTGTTGQSTTTVPTTSLAADKASFVQIHDSSGKAVACGDLPGHGSGTVTGATPTTTGY